MAWMTHPPATPCTPHCRLRRAAPTPLWCLQQATSQQAGLTAAPADSWGCSTACSKSIRRGGSLGSRSGRDGTSSRRSGGRMAMLAGTSSGSSGGRRSGRDGNSSRCSAGRTIGRGVHPRTMSARARQTRATGRSSSARPSPSFGGAASWCPCRGCRTGRLCGPGRTLDGRATRGGAGQARQAAAQPAPPLARERARHAPRAQHSRRSHSRPAGPAAAWVVGMAA